jgi:ATP/maltotriose-dependent transcriptional regulator MalT
MCASDIFFMIDYDISELSMACSCLLSWNSPFKKPTRVSIPDVPLTSTRLSQLAEPLTEREREVLRLLLVGASNREIARDLVLSVNTVKRHVYNLSGKLGVRSRMQAVIRARALNLL